MTEKQVSGLDLARAVQIARAHAGIQTALDLAQVSGVSREHIWRVVNGTSDPRLSFLQKIAKACGVPVSRLLQWAEGGDA